MPELALRRQLTLTVYTSLRTPITYSPDDPHHRLGPVHTCLYVILLETTEFYLSFARVETGELTNGYVSMSVNGWQSEWNSQGLPESIQTPASLGYPLSWFSKHYTFIPVPEFSGGLPVWQLDQPKQKAKGKTCKFELCVANVQQRACKSWIVLPWGACWNRSNIVWSCSLLTPCVVALNYSSRIPNPHVLQQHSHVEHSKLLFYLQHHAT